MDGPSFDEKIKAGEEVECAVDPECPKYLRRSATGEGVSIVGSARPNASITAFIPRIVHTHKKATAVATTADHGRNRWDVSLTHARPPHVTSWEVIMVAETKESKRQDATLRRCASHSVGSEPEAVQVPKGPDAG
jgi:hypothetical protein